MGAKSWGFDPHADMALQGILLIHSQKEANFLPKEVLYIHAKTIDKNADAFWIIELRNYRRFLISLTGIGMGEVNFIETPTDSLAAEEARLKFDRPDIEKNLKRQLNLEQEYGTYQEETSS
jgi:hypothetical protein